VSLLRAALLTSIGALASACVSVPTAPPPLPAQPTQVVSAGAFVYDTADPESPLGGAQTWGRVHVGPHLDVGGSLQLSLGAAGRPRFVGGSLLAGGRYAVDEGLTLGLELGAEYVDAFSYLRSFREPVATMTLAFPVAFRPLRPAWFWVRPAIGAAAPLRLINSPSGLSALSTGVWPAWRLSYGASWDFDWVIVYGESSTTLPFGGAYLGFGAAVAL
jgi:hypothetical protein